MNQPFQSDPNQNQFQAQPAPSQPSTPFESTPPTIAQQAAQPPVQPQPEQPSGGFQPTGMEPAHSGGKSSWWLIIILVVILLAGVLLFASWEGWINLGGISKLWQKNTTTTTTTSTAETTANANDKTRKADLANLKTALKSYYQANQSYPIAATSQKTSDTNGALSALVPTYIAKLPIDPLSPTYYYGYKSDGKTFELTAVLEDQNDASGTLSGAFNIYKVTEVSVETPVSASQTTTTGTTDTTNTTTTTGTGQTSTTQGASSSTSTTTGSASASSSATAQ